VYVVWIYFFVPETKDRTLEEIDEMFEAGVPARKFKTYVCIKSNEAREMGARHERKEDIVCVEDVRKDSKM
jgi:hypothetical protein